MGAEDEAECDQAEVVRLAGSAGEECERPAAATPESREGEQPAADHVAREVLLADVDRPFLPVEADLSQGRQDDVAQDDVEAERRQGLVEHRVHAGLVIRANRREQACRGVGGRPGERLR